MHFVITNLLNLTQSYQAQKVNDILFSGSTNNPLDWESELIRLKVNDLTTQISSKKDELTKIIANAKNKFSKAKKYLLERLLPLTRNDNLTELVELKEALQDHQETIETILTKQKELKDLESYLEQLQKNQLETKIEVNNNNLWNY